MKPLRLRLRAFGAFAGELDLDFRLLGDRQFFLIHGPTGAGKSTILDALCFALYGETSGEERTGAQMRSDYATPETPTEVVLDFRVGREAYRVKRSPEYERAKKRGEGTTTMKAEATLWRRTECTDDAEDGIVMAGRSSQVSEEVERLLGFRADEFRHVVVLPQGRFREVLTTSTDDRGKIFEKLFRTSHYAKVQRLLKEREARLKGELNDALTARDALLKAAGAADEAELRALLEGVAAEVEAAEKAQAEAEASELSARTTLEAARGIDAKFVEAAKAAEAFAALEAKQEEHAQLGARIEAAARAALVDAPAAHAALAEQDAAKARERAGESARAAIAKREEAARAAARLAGAEARVPEQDAARAELSALDAMQVRVQALTSARAGAQSAAQAWEAAKARHADAVKDAESAQRAAKQAADALALAAPLAQQVATRRAAAMAAGRVLDAARECVEVLRRLDSERDVVESHSGALEKAKAAADAAHAEVAAYEAKWFGDQAVLLAERLVPGDPCAVCGSREHPAPAASVDGGVTQEALTRVRKSAHDADAAVLERTTALANANRAVARSLERLEAIRKSLGESLAEVPAAEDFTQHLPAWQKAAEAAAAALREAEAAEAQLPALSSADEKARTALEGANAAIADAQSDASRHEGLALSAAQTLQSAAADVPEQWQRDGALAAAREAHQSLIDAIERELTAARDAASETRTAEAAAVSTAEADANHATDRTIAATTARAALVDALAQHGFADEAAYQAARLDPAALAQLQQSHTNFANDFAAARDRRDRAKAATESLTRPDLAALEAAHGTALAAVGAAATASGTIRQRHASLCATLDDIARRQAAYAADEARYRTVNRLKRLADGTDTPRRIDFQTYVQLAYLEDVLAAASRRLQRMTLGRFRLVTHDAALDKRSKEGLDIDVHDAHTDAVRSARTLSGGEGFMAALSLALGLADVVQQNAGGIHLDTIFVDEGFGSLDQESLDAAMRALIDLQEGGRMVGVISHVTEMLQQIPTRLEVTGGRAGSAARFVVG